MCIHSIYLQVVKGVWSVRGCKFGVVYKVYLGGCIWMGVDSYMCNYCSGYDKGAIIVLVLVYNQVLCKGYNEDSFIDSIGLKEECQILAINNEFW